MAKFEGKNVEYIFMEKFQTLFQMVIKKVIG